MKKAKQIEEMAEDLQKSEHWYFNDHSVDFELDRKKTAENLYTAGYRKQNEGAWVFEFTLEGDDFYKCSVCGRQEVINGLCKERNPAEHYPYCHCGAKMKGGAE